jgi:hypothetical protein
MNKKSVIVLAVSMFIMLSANAVFAGDGNPKNVLQDLQLKVSELTNTVANLVTSVTNLDGKVNTQADSINSLQNELNSLKDTVATQQQEINTQKEAVNKLRGMFKNTIAQFRYNAFDTQHLPANAQMVFTDTNFGDVYRFDVVKDHLPQIGSLMQIPVGTYIITAETPTGEKLATLEEPVTIVSNIAAPSIYGNLSLEWDGSKYWIGIEAGL